MSLTIKICGLTRTEDISSAVGYGANALGFVFAKSPRQLGIAQAQSLVTAVPDGVCRIGLFMDQSRADIEAVLDHVELDWLQFHGRETEADCQRYGMPYIKAVSMSESDPEEVAARYASAAGILLDSHAPGGAGGTGHSFDWRRRVHSAKPLWLAGGLRPDNVAAAIHQFQPHAVDVSSGVESSPGIKDDALLHDFMVNARQASNERTSTANQ